MRKVAFTERGTHRADAIAEIRCDLDRRGRIFRPIWPVRNIGRSIEINIGAEAAGNRWTREARRVIRVAIAMGPNFKVTGLHCEADVGLQCCAMLNQNVGVFSKV